MKALKAVRKALCVDGPTWPAEDVATLIEALKEQVQPPPPGAEPETTVWAAPEQGEERLPSGLERFFQVP